MMTPTPATQYDPTPVLLRPIFIEARSKITQEKKNSKIESIYQPEHSSGRISRFVIILSGNMSKLRNSN